MPVTALGRDQGVQRLPAPPNQGLGITSRRCLRNDTDNGLRTGRANVHPPIRPAHSQSVLQVDTCIGKRGLKRVVHCVEWSLRPVELLFHDGVLRISCHKGGQPCRFINEQLQRERGS